jgi:hypothetical protein
MPSILAWRDRRFIEARFQRKVRGWARRDRQCDQLGLDHVTKFKYPVVLIRSVESSICSRPDVNLPLAYLRKRSTILAADGIFGPPLDAVTRTRGAINKE